MRTILIEKWLRKRNRVLGRTRQLGGTALFIPGRGAMCPLLSSSSAAALQQLSQFLSDPILRHLRNVTGCGAVVCMLESLTLVFYKQISPLGSSRSDAEVQPIPHLQDSNSPQSCDVIRPTGVCKQELGKEYTLAGSGA